MTADTSLKILVIVLSATLAVFLLIAIALMIKLLQVASALKRVAAKAEDIADKAEVVTEFFENVSGPVAIGRFLTNIADMVGKKSNRKK